MRHLVCVSDIDVRLVMGFNWMGVGYQYPSRHVGGNRLGSFGGGRCVPEWIISRGARQTDFEFL